MPCSEKSCSDTACPATHGCACKGAEKGREKETIEEFYVAGVNAQISNDGQNAAEEINALWQRFMEEGTSSPLLWTEGEAIYVVYHDYEGDHTKPFRATIGYKVNEGAPVPETLSAVRVESGKYGLFAARGAQPEALMKIWQTIWNSDLKRTYRTDLELYGPRFFEDGLHEVLVCIGIKNEEDQ